ncbi:M24 family metallopeptidase [Mesorhizobium sp. A556]
MSGSILTNFDRLFAVMEESGLDAMVGTSAENVVYLSGFWAMTQWARRTPQTYVLAPGRGKGEPSIVTSSGLVDLIADQEPWVKAVRRYGFFQLDRDAEADLNDKDIAQLGLMEGPEYPGPVEALVAAIRDNRLERATLGIDEVSITPQNFDQLRQALPDAEFVRAASLLQKVRAIKTPEEIRRLRQAARIGEMSIDAAMGIAAAGVTELDFMREFNRTTVSNDGLPVSICIGFGERSAMSNVQPSERALAIGDAIRFDVGGRYRHYRSDISRCGFFGEPGARIRRYHGALHKGVMRAHELVRPGLRICDVFSSVMDTVRAEGIPHYKRNHVGHGIGIDGYDYPNIAPGDQATLEEGMVVCVETPYYELGFAGLQVEDMLVVTADGAETLMSTDGALRIIEP